MKKHFSDLNCKHLFQRIYKSSVTVCKLHKILTGLKKLGMDTDEQVEGTNYEAGEFV